MNRKMTRAELEAELRLLKRSRFNEGFVQVCLSLIRAATVILIARYAYLAISVMAGQETSADIFISFLGNVSVSYALAWGAGIGGTVYGLNQRDLRRKTVERLQGRIREIEVEKDPERTSSNLTNRWETRPEERI